jgi:hypothetical protein
MTDDTSTPMAKFLSHLLSLGQTGHSLAETIRLAELAFGGARYGGSADEIRERERIRKADWRRRNPGHVPGQKAYPLSSKTVVNTVIKKERKKEPNMVVPGQIGTLDDWPADFLEQFWKAFPPFRRQAKGKVGAKLARIRSDGKVTWATIIEGVAKFAATNPGEYAPAPIVWLNDGRWDREYGELSGKTFNGHRANSAAGSKKGADAILAGVGRFASRFAGPKPAAEFEDGDSYRIVDVTPGSTSHR